MPSKPGMGEHERELQPSAATLNLRPRDEGRPALLDGLRQDLRYAVRTLRRDAGFTRFAMLIVGLGIGASATVFSVANAAPASARCRFAIRASSCGSPTATSSGLSGQTTQVAHFSTCASGTQSFSDVAGYFAFYGVGDSKLTRPGRARAPERRAGLRELLPAARRPAELGRQLHRRGMQMERTRRRCC